MVHSEDSVVGSTGKRQLLGHSHLCPLCLHHFLAFCLHGTHVACIGHAWTTLDSNPMADISGISDGTGLLRINF
jgi:hypothetical protein